MKTAIVGYGHVGKAMHELFPHAAVFDIAFANAERQKNEVNAADVAFVCVPTPQNADGSVDISAVEEVCGWLEAEVICIKSTVPPGTTDALCDRTRKRIVMSPEYFGESTFWLPEEFTPKGWPFVIAGGHPDDAEFVLRAFQRVLGPAKTYMATTAVNAELVKYMENCWLATQVMFGYEFSRIAQLVGADYSQVRELWALDPRVSKWHTLVMEKPGFGGKCLPKDLAGIIAASEALGFEPAVLSAVKSENDEIRGGS